MNHFKKALHCLGYGTMYKVVPTRQSKKDAVNIQRSGLRPQVEKIVSTVEKKPYEHSQSFEELKGKLKGKYSRRISKEHRFVYEVLPNSTKETDENNVLYKGIVRVLSIWSHYERV